MKIVLSAHFDLNKQVPFIQLTDKRLNGLVDNFAGVFAAYQASRKTGVELYLTNFEEDDLSGANKVARLLKKDKDTLVIVVDTCTDANGKKAYIGNTYYLNTEPLKKEFSKNVRFVDGYFEPTEDETASYGWGYKIPCLFFGVPIENNYHDTNNTLEIKTIDEATNELVKLIKFLKKNQKKIIDFEAKRLPIDPENQ